MLEVSVCIGSACHIKGSYNVMQAFQQIIEENELHEKCDLKAKFCMQKCHDGVSVSIGDDYFSVSPESARGFFKEIIASPKFSLK
jgi:NADH:ubiquinone oxidoreductase subunit E